MLVDLAEINLLRGSGGMHAISRDIADGEGIENGFGIHGRAEFGERLGE